MRTLPIILLILLISCSTDKKEPAGQATVKPILLETFEDLPDELEGEGCAFARTIEENEKGKYVFASNYDSLAFVRIGRQYERLKLTQVVRDQKSNERTSEMYENSLWKVEVVTKSSKPSTDYNNRYEGTIRASRKDGNAQPTVTNYVGDCGC